MKLYCDPTSTTCRPVMLFAAEAGIALDLVHVSLMNGEQQAAAFLGVNPNGQVPVLDDDGFVLTECTAILRYLAGRVGSPAYPQAPRARAKVDEALDWFNTGFYRDAACSLVYPNVLPKFGPATPAAQQQARLATRRRLEVLDRHMLGDRAFVCGEEISLADYLGSSLVALLEIVAYDLADHPNVERWMGRMRRLDRWDEVYAAFEGLLSALRRRAAAAS